LIFSAAAAPVVPFLPVCVKREMTRSFVMGGGGDEISYDWRLMSLYSFFQAIDYLRPEEGKAWLPLLNVALTLGWIVALGLLGASLWTLIVNARDR
jgi:hypothetical protein